MYFNTSDLLRKKGHHVINFSSSNPLNEYNENSGYFIDLSDNRKAGMMSKFMGVKKYVFNKDASFNLRKLIHNTKPDIAHLHLFYGGLTSSILKALKDCGIPVVQTVHDYRYLCPANAFLDKRSRICEKCKNRFYLQCSIFRCLENNFFYSSILTMEAYTRKYLLNPLEFIDHFIFVSKFSKDKHVQFYKAFENKSSLLYNFTFLPESSSISRGPGYLLFFGRLSNEKGIMSLLKAVKSSSLKLVIAGTGPLLPKVESVLLSATNVEYLGHKNTMELEGLIRNAAYIVVPSEWYENNPMTVLESFAHGKPVIGSRIGGIPEIVRENETGFLFESGNIEDMSGVINSADRITDYNYSEMSKNARNYAAENFSPEEHYLKLMDIYSKILH